MAYDGRVYRILIASPSDVEDERDIAVRVIQEWNDLYSYTRRVVLLPLRWETHTAPEYGVRPQEVINRAIVDNCDLLLGVFWTRIGTPTDKAESGTLEEIERVANAGKPVMLYFSKVGVDPDTLDLNQVARLKKFKEAIYPNGLIESFISQIAFRDKFAKQLELKVRELQKDDSTGITPLALQFSSLDTGKLIGTHQTQEVSFPKVKDISAVISSKEPPVGQRLQQAIEQTIETRITRPVVLAISNTSTSGVRNIFAEIHVRVVTGDAVVSNKEPQSQMSLTKLRTLANDSSWGDIFASDSDIEKQINRLHNESFEKTDDGWRFAFEWGAIQPQRVRFVRPALFITPKCSCKIDFQANVFADSFPQPVTIESSLELKLNDHPVELDDLIPNYEKLLASPEEDDDLESMFEAADFYESDSEQID